jgi:Cof subfamily protein (haloacid dehalogenase superfamily)
MEPSSIRLLAIDVDGTLLDSMHQLRPDVRDAVCSAAASGLGIALATARGPTAVKEIVSQFDFSPWLICFSGAWIGRLNSPLLETSAVESDERIPYDAGCLILKIALSHHLEPNVFTPSCWRVRSITSEILDESRILNLQPSLVSDLLLGGEGPSKVLLIGKDGEEVDALFKVQDSIRTFSNATFSKANYLEIIPAGIDKARGLKVLGEALDLGFSQMAAIGDAPNDVEMLREAGLAIAMGNASSVVKSNADWVVGTNDEGRSRRSDSTITRRIEDECECQCFGSGEQIRERHESFPKRNSRQSKRCSRRPKSRFVTSN